MSQSLVLFGTFGEWVEANWLGIVVSSILGLITTVVVGGIIYRWQKREKLPKYANRAINLITNTDKTYPDLRVHYKGHGPDLDNLTVGLVAFWNAGRETIRGNDIAPADPLAITGTNGAIILGASILASNNPVSNAKSDFSKAQNSVLITFDFLDQYHGCVVELLHTGKSDADLAVSGTIIGAGPIQAAIKRKKTDAASKQSKNKSRHGSQKYIRLVSRILMLITWSLYIVGFGMTIFMEPVADNGIEVEGQAYIETKHFSRIEHKSDREIVVYRVKSDHYPIIDVATLMLIAMTFIEISKSRAIQSPLPRGLEAFDDHPYD